MEKEKKMKSGRIKEYIPFFVFTLAFILMSLMTLLPGCSRKAPEKKADTEYTTASSTTDSEEPVFAPIKDKILNSIQEAYDGTGVKIVSIELSAKPYDLATIELTYPGHTSSQSILAGLSILWNNFPKLTGYSAKAGGKDVSAIPGNIAYIESTGYSLDCSADDAEKYLDIVVNGPSPAGGETVKAQVG
jgi:hypothetical protein